MGRNNDQAKAGATSAQNISNQSAANSGALYSTLAPQLEAEAAHPAGYSPVDMAAMNTAAMQTGGGAMAGAVGQGGLEAARTRNAGGSDAAIQESARNAGQQASRGALGTQINNANLKEQQRRAALGGLESLYGGNLNTSVGALGQVAGNVNADTNAENASWDWTKGLSALSQAGNAGAGFYRQQVP